MSSTETLVLEINLTREDLRKLENVLNSLNSIYCSGEGREVQEACLNASDSLPRELLAKMRRIQPHSNSVPAILIRGFEIDQTKIGDSPASWDAPWFNVRWAREEIAHSLFSATVGFTFGWKTQENGRLIRHVTPTYDEREEQLGGGSLATLLWHTEEAFHESRADVVSLMCYRNREAVSTNLVDMSEIALPDDLRAVLTQSRFLIRPDESHLEQNNFSRHWELESNEYEIRRKRSLEPLSTPVILEGSFGDRFIVDQAFMTAKPGDEEAQYSLNIWHTMLEHNAVSITLEPGDMIFFNNHTVAHSRSCFVSDYGPEKRWVRRMNIHYKDSTKSDRRKLVV